MNKLYATLLFSLVSTLCMGTDPVEKLARKAQAKLTKRLSKGKVAKHMSEENRNAINAALFDIACKSSNNTKDRLKLLQEAHTAFMVKVEEARQNRKNNPKDDLCANAHRNAKGQRKIMHKVFKTYQKTGIFFDHI